MLPSPVPPTDPGAEALGDLARWADAALDSDADRQYIAEHMLAVVSALAEGRPTPAPPF